MILTPSELSALAKVASQKADTLGFVTPCDRGHVLQRERIAMLAERCCEQKAGDIIEVGAFHGVTSSILADIARRHGRKLICVDDFVTRNGFEHYSAEVAFRKVVEDNRDVIEWWRIDAHSPETIAMIQVRRFCWAFSDDGHSYNDHVTELHTLLPVLSGLCCVDDRYLPWVDQAADDVSAELGWTVLRDERLSEAYLEKTT